jgi:hypothetical protein
MAEVRVQARFTLTPGDGTNHATNTFHFYDAVTGYAAHAADALAAVQAFYTAAPAGASQSLGAQMGDVVLRAAELRAYDMSTPEPRVPTILPITLPATLNPNSKCPLEVACCVSYLAAPPVNGRKRGRIYLPGVTDGWFSTGGPAAVPLLQSGAFSEADIAARAAAALTAHSADWSIRSMATGAAVYYRVASTYVDTEPDTMRSRGTKSGAPRIAY